MPTIYSETNDGFAGHGLAPWADSRGGAGNAFDSNDASDIEAVWSFYHSGRGTWGIRRAFFEFDTLGITVAPSAATLKIRGVTNGTGDVIAVKSEQGGTLSAADFYSGLPSAARTALDNSDGNGAGTLAGVSGFTYSAEITTWSTSGYNDIALNATALADMASLDTFKVCLMNYDNDYLDQDGTANEQNGLYWTEAVTSLLDPKIDYTDGALGYGNDVIGIDSGDISKINGIATADISKVNGV